MIYDLILYNPKYTFLLLCLYDSKEFFLVRLAQFLVQNQCPRSLEHQLFCYTILALSRKTYGLQEIISPGNLGLKEDPFAPFYYRGREGDQVPGPTLKTYRNGILEILENQSNNRCS